MLLLDTCTLLWMAGDPSKLSPAAKEQLRQHAGVLYVSAVTGFEIAQKTAKGKLTLPLSPSLWMELVLRLHGLRSLDLSLPAAIMAGELQRLHDDPFDRLLIASAQANHLILMTPDPKVRQHPEPLKTLW